MKNSRLSFPPKTGAALLLTVVLLTTAPMARAAQLLYSNDVLGEIEPCGCRSNPLGGMARKAGLIKKLEDKSMLQLDGGDLLFQSDSLPGALEKQAELQASYLIKAMNEVHHDAVVPGEKDFALGYKIFEKLRSKAKFKFLAANLRLKKGGKNPFAAHEIYIRKNNGKPIRIAVFGLVGEAIKMPSELRVTASLAAAKSEVKALRSQADIVIALTHQGYDADVALAKAVSGIDIIVGGHTQSFLQEPPLVRKTRIYQSSFRNQYIGVLPLVVPFKGADHQLLGLDAGYDSPANTPGPVDKIASEAKKKIGDLNSKAELDLMKENESAPGQPKIAKYQTFPRCAECHLKQFNFWRKTKHAQALSALMEKDQYKNRECLGCHTVGLDEKDGEGFHDVTRLAERKTVNTETSSEEIKPLTTEEWSEYLKKMVDADNLNTEVKISSDDSEKQPLKRTLNIVSRAWSPVQCENCHMPGKDHPFSSTYIYKKTVAKDACLKCHTAERAPEWYTKPGQPDWEKIASKRVLVTCPAGDLALEE